MINKPSVEAMTNDNLNRYELVIATAKCARIITDEYVEQRAYAEKLIERKETDKPISALIDKDIRDEKAVKNALRQMKNGEYEVFLPGEEGYEEASVVIENYVPTEKIDYIPKPIKIEADEEDDNDDITEEFDDFDEEIDSAELMGADEVFNNDSGYSIEDGEEN